MSQESTLRVSGNLLERRSPIVLWTLFNKASNLLYSEFVGVRVRLEVISNKICMEKNVIYNLSVFATIC